MRLSELFFTTLRDDPAEAEMPSHRLLLRAGYVRQLGSGIYSLLPLGFRVTKRVEQVIREEMNAIGCQELEMPVVHPAEVWKDSGRYFKIGPELVRFKDRGERDMVLAMTHEEVIALLLRDIVQSYRQLPVQLYHFQTKFRDEPRSRGGLIRVREFVMKDAYSCDLDDAGLDVSYRKQYGAYEKIFKRLGLDAIAVGSDVGIMGGSGAHEFMVLNEFGEDTLVLCDACGYAENQQIAEVAQARRRRPSRRCRWRTSKRPARRRSMPSRRFLGVPRSEDRQGGVLRHWRRPVRRGHRARRLRRQRDEADQRDQGHRRAAAGPGRRDQGPRHGGRLRLAAGRPRRARRRRRARPRGHRTSSPARTAPAGTSGTSTSRATTRRTWSPRSRTPARATPASAAAQPVKLRKGIEVGNIFKLGTDFTVAAGATYLGEDGERHPIVMGSYGIGLGRNVACIVEAHHDEKGIVWPDEVAPYAAHLVTIGAARDEAVTDDRRAAPRRSPPRPGARSSTTIATSRRASSSPTPSCSACPGS